MQKVNKLKHCTIYFSYLFVVWGFYRLLLEFPENIEELAIKPLLWLIPLIYFLKVEKASIASLGITFERLFPSIYLSLGLGVIFAFEGIIANYFKYGSLNFGANIGNQVLTEALGITFVTAITEEIAFRGYLFNRLWEVIKNEWSANIITGVGWTIMHFPIAFFNWKLDSLSLITYLALVFIFSLGSAFLFARTRNIFSSIFLHVLWQWPIILFR